MKISLAFWLSVIFILSACGGNGVSETRTNDEQPTALTRNCAMGFTPWLYEASVSAQNTTYARLIAHGDIIKHHLMGGIPWQAALDRTAYHPNVEAEINDRLSRTPNSMKVFLAIDSLNAGRSALAPNWGESDSMPLPPEWTNRSWSSSETITAYINFAIDMIDRFQPSYFEYGTEISELILNDPEGSYGQIWCMANHAAPCC